MRTQPRHLIVCYDIADPKRLRKVYRVMRGFGDHLQFSVFLCRLSPIQRARMVEALVHVIKPTEDQVVLVDLGLVDPDSRIETLGRPMVHTERVIRIVHQE